MQSLAGALATLSTSCGINDAKLGSFSSTFLTNALINLGNMARELGGSPFRCNTDPNPAYSSCAIFSFYVLSKIFLIKKVLWKTYTLGIFCVFENVWGIISVILRGIQGRTLVATNRLGAKTGR